MQLDNNQMAIVTTDFPKVLVSAPAASGKTTLIAERVKYLIQEGIQSYRICVLSYTNMAVEELQSRISHKMVNISTIHGLVNKILRFNDIDTTPYLLKGDFCGLLKCMLRQPQYVYPQYDVLIVDEFQDTGEIEFNILQKIKAKQRMYIGDPRQRIFGFKNGKFDPITIVSHDYKWHTMHLLNNYRNAPNILRYGESYISDQGFACQTPIKEKDGEIWDKNNKTNFSTIIDDILIFPDYNEWAIICNTNAQIEQVKKILIKRVIPYVIYKVKNFHTLQERRRVMQCNKVKLLTIHSSKGLEFTNVGVIGANKYNEESARLCYVAATRAKERLYWVNKVIE